MTEMTSEYLVLIYLVLNRLLDVTVGNETADDNEKGSVKQAAS